MKPGRTASIFFVLIGTVLISGCSHLKERSKDGVYQKEGVFSFRLNGCYVKYEKSKLTIQSEGLNEFVLQVNTEPELSIKTENWDTCISIDGKAVYLYRQRYREEPLYYYYCQTNFCEITGYFVGEYMPENLVTAIQTLE